MGELAAPYPLPYLKWAIGALNTEATDANYYRDKHKEIGSLPTREASELLCERVGAMVMAIERGNAMGIPISFMYIRSMQAHSWACPPLQHVTCPQQPLVLTEPYQWYKIWGEHGLAECASYVVVGTPSVPSTRPAYYYYTCVTLACTWVGRGGIGRERPEGRYPMSQSYINACVCASAQIL